ncbi:MAG: CAP domain-containing protein [Actinomycetota bacterium]|nr:CAP domain-containing protein [Actinomycetota bacterium]
MTHTTKLVFGPLACLVAVLALGAGVPASAQAGCAKSGEPVRSISKKNARAAIGCLFNKERTAANVKRNGDVETAAQRHSGVMASKYCYSHQCPGEPDLKERIARTGYLRGASGFELGEVIHRLVDNASPRQIVREWMNSPPHGDAIRKSSYDHVGIGISIRGGLVFATGDLARR